MFPKRYLLNTNTREVHDTNNYDPSCYIFHMKEEHKVWFDSLSEALAFPYDDCVKRNDGCKRCLSKYHTR